MHDATPFRPMTIRDRWRALIERALPWYDPHLEAGRNGRTEAIRLRAIRERQKVERVLDDYAATDARIRIR